jgi:enoyl-CoA hydratase/carnithine racemase
LLDALRPAAAALECNLVHALVPRRPLEQVVQERARHKASAALTTVEHSMRLEDQ